jgi:glycopeptide antibiotics resistance protein
MLDTHYQGLQYQNQAENRCSLVLMNTSKTGLFLYKIQILKKPKMNDFTDLSVGFSGLSLGFFVFIFSKKSNFKFDGLAFRKSMKPIPTGFFRFS